MKGILCEAVIEVRLVCFSCRSVAGGAAKSTAVDSGLRGAMRTKGTVHRQHQVARHQHATRHRRVHQRGQSNLQHSPTASLDSIPLLSLI